MPSNQKKIIAGLLIVGAAALLLFLLYGLNNAQEYFFSYQNPDALSADKSAKLKDPINVLFLGVAGEGSRGALLTDAIFIANIIPDRQQITMVSIPRDLWIEIPHSSAVLKINVLYKWENKGKSFSQSTSYSLIKEKVEEITGLPMDYVVVLDLEGLEKVVDDLGGIDIWLEEDIQDPNLVNPHDPSEIFHLSSGWRHLDGALVVKFIRTRYAPEGDFSRIEHQQQIISALKDKLAQLSNIWNLSSWLKIWQSLNENIITDLDFNTAWQVLPIVKNISAGQIQYLRITNREPDQLLITSSIYDESSDIDIYALIPALGFENYEGIQSYLREKIYGSD